MTRLNTEHLADEHPSLDLLIEKYGVMEAGKKIGMNSIGEAITRRRVRLCYELAAAKVLIDEGENRPKLIVIKLNDHQQKSAVMTLLNAMGVEYMDLDL